MDYREKTLEIINKVYAKKAIPKELLSVEVENKTNNIEKIYRIVNGVLENRLLLDNIIGKYSKVKLTKYRTIDLALIEIGAYEILFMDNTPSYATISQLNKIFIRTNKNLKPMAIGILKTIDKNSNEILNSLNQIEPNIRYSHPKWLYEIMKEKFGENRSNEIMKKNNESSILNIRVNKNKISIEEFSKSFIDKYNITLKKSYIVEDMFLVENLNGNRIIYLDEFKNGYFYIQDPGSALIQKMALKNDSQTFLDLCSSPGGKSIGSAIDNENLNITSCDIGDEKLRRIDENIKRMHIKNIKLLKNDALVLNEDFINYFDSVLLDAPCSGLGIIYSKPDIRFNRSIEDIQTLASMQYKMINISKEYVKINGILVYSTCTFTDEENMDIVNKFLLENENFVLCDEGFKHNLIKDGILDTMEEYEYAGGFFAARFKRVK